MSNDVEVVNPSLVNDVFNRLANPKINISKEKLEEIRKTILESLSVDRQSILTTMPFIGGMLMRMEIVPVRDYRCDTAMTDGSNIFFDMDFYKSLDRDQRKFVLAHEIWHVVYMHFLRQQNRNRELWNIATDCEINYMLTNEGFKPPENLCFPSKRDEGKNAEEIYNHLLKQIKNQKKKSSKNPQDSNDNDSAENDSSNKDDDSNKDKKNNKKDKFSGQFDKHFYENDEKEESDKIELPKDSWGEKGEDPNFTPRISNNAAEKIREMIISEAQRCERTQGTLPGGLSEFIKELRTPELNWREYLAQFVTKCLGDKRVWLPPNRHHVWSGSYFQSRRGEKIKVIVTVDTSGSTLQDLPKFMTELISLLNTFGNYQLTLIQCDAEVQNITTYDENNEFPLNNPELFQWKGFGGSDLNPAFEEISKREIEASMHIVFTDGMIDVPQTDPLGIPTLFIITNDGDDQLCSWGEKVKFKNNY